MPEKTAKKPTTKKSSTSKTKHKSFQPNQAINTEQMIGMIIFFIVVTVASGYAFLNTFSF